MEAFVWTMKITKLTKRNDYKIANHSIELTGECSSGLLTYRPASSYRRYAVSSK